MNKRTIKILSLLIIAVLSFSSIAWVRPPGVTGGGTLVQSTGSGWSSISIWGWASGTEGSTRGSWYITFNNVADDSLDRARFASWNVSEINYYAADSATCKSAVNLTAYGSLNGQPGYYVILRFGDGLLRYGDDTVRVELYDPGSVKLFDTHGSEYPDESSCVGTGRTGLDYGGVRVTLP